MTFGFTVHLRNHCCMLLGQILSLVRIRQQVKQLLILIGVLSVVTARVWPLLRQGILVGDEWILGS